MRDERVNESKSEREKERARDERQETRDEGRVSERIQVWAIIFLNRLGQNEKSEEFTGKSGIVCI
jgi:hypothetical protein